MIIDFYDDLGEAFFLHLQGNDPPELLKEASWAEPNDLLDRDYAVILVSEEGQELRKFACHDAGNTAMSMWYLAYFKDELPAAVTKVAAVNLAVAADAYGLEVPQEIFDLNVDVAPEWADDLLDERRVKVVQQALSPQRDEQDKTASAVVSPFDVLHHAQENWDDLDPFQRHDIAVYLCKEGSAAGVVVPDSIHVYGGTELNPRFEMLMEHRKNYTTDVEHQADFERLGKRAHVMPLEDVVETLYLMDERASLTPRYGNGLPDPLLAVYGQTKEAEFSWCHGTDMVNASQLYRFAGSPRCKLTLGDLFAGPICLAFKKDPVGTFQAMPDEQKILLARLATQSGGSNDGGLLST